MDKGAACARLATLYRRSLELRTGRLARGLRWTSEESQFERFPAAGPSSVPGALGRWSTRLRRRRLPLGYRRLSGPGEAACTTAFDIVPEMIDAARHKQRGRAAVISRGP